MRISKQLREDAILILAVEASTPEMTGNTAGTAMALDLSQEANDIAYWAWKRVHGRAHCLGPADDARCEEYAEAEALLHNGANPAGKDWSGFYG